MEISTSILNVKENANQRFYDIEVARTDYFHIDVMDGKFVKNSNQKKMKEYSVLLKQMTPVGLDVHLMCEDAEKFVEEYIDLVPDTITFHVEVIKDKEEALKLIRKITSNHIKVGLAINPDTKIEKLYEYLEYIHKVIVMTVVPGKGGQKLIESTIEKIKKLKEYVDNNNLDTIIEADGGINDENINKLEEAGVEIAVVGSYLTSSDDIVSAMKKLK